MRKNYTHRLDIHLMEELERRCEANNTPIHCMSKARVIEHCLRRWLDSADSRALLPESIDTD